MAASDTFRVTPIVKFLLNMQVFLLRRNMMGPAGNFIMVITTKGRRSGKLYSRPITYIWDGDTIVGTNTGLSNWYKNALANPEVTLEVKGRRMQARCVPANSPEEKQAIFEVFRREQAANFVRIFGLPADAPEEELFKARDKRVFVRFVPKR